MSMVMPLGVLANQLIKIEGDLRFLSMKAAELSDENDPRSTKAVDARLELIHELLKSIQALLGQIQTSLHPKEPAEAYKAAPDLED